MISSSLIASISSLNTLIFASDISAPGNTSSNLLNPWSICSWVRVPWLINTLWTDVLLVILSFGISTPLYKLIDDLLIAISLLSELSTLS